MVELVPTPRLRRLSAGLRGTQFDKVARRSAKIMLNPLLGALRPGNVAMFHVGRVGSTVVTKMLRQSRRIYWAGEIFDHSHPRYAEEFNSPPRQPEPIKYLRSMMRDAGSRTFGFETKFLDELHLSVVQLGLEEYLDTLYRLGFNRFIVIRRENILRVLVSMAALGQTKRSHLAATEAAQKNRVAIEIDSVWMGTARPSLVDAIRLIENGYERLSSLLPPDRVCELTYEEHIRDDPMVGYEEIMSFIGVKPETPDIPLQKTNPYPLAEIIENFDEVERALSGTPYSWMLSD